MGDLQPGILNLRLPAERKSSCAEFTREGSIVGPHPNQSKTWTFQDQDYEANYVFQDALIASKAIGKTQRYFSAPAALFGSEVGFLIRTNFSLHPRPKSLELVSPHPRIVFIGVCIGIQLECSV